MQEKFLKTYEQTLDVQDQQVELNFIYNTNIMTNIENLIKTVISDTLTTKIRL